MVTDINVERLYPRFVKIALRICNDFQKPHFFAMKWPQCFLRDV